MTTFSSNVDDMVCAARQVEEELGPVQLLVGHSMGGAATILAAEQLTGVKAVATIGAPSKPLHVKQHLEADLEKIHREEEAVVGARRYVKNPITEGLAHRQPDRTRRRMYCRETPCKSSGRGFPLIADEPPERGGTDERPRPHDYLSVGLASCISITARMYADRKGWPLESITVDADYRRAGEEDEGPVDRVDCHAKIEGDLDTKQRRRIFEIASRCPVHRTLVSGAKSESTLDA